MRYGYLRVPPETLSPDAWLDRFADIPQTVGNSLQREAVFEFQNCRDSSDPCAPSFSRRGLAKAAPRPVPSCHGNPGASRRA